MSKYSVALKGCLFVKCYKVCIVMLQSLHSWSNDDVMDLGPLGHLQDLPHIAGNVLSLQGSHALVHGIGGSLGFQGNSLEFGLDQTWADLCNADVVVPCSYLQEISISEYF